MAPETALLCDVIRAVPNGSCWYITSDSWNRIPAIFDSLLEITVGGEWLVRLTDRTKEKVLRKIVRHELAGKMVHLEISSPQRCRALSELRPNAGNDLTRLPGLEAELRQKFPSLVGSVL